MSTAPQAVQAILVVDDDPAVHELLAAALERPGRRVETAANGLEALEKLQRTGFDLVLTDIRMPGMDGLELLRRIRQVSAATKVIVMTAHSTPASVIDAIRQQAFAYFSKPFSVRAVADAIAQALECEGCQDDIEVVSARPEWITLRARCRVETAERLVQFLRELKMDLPPKLREELALAFRELLLNAIEHGGRSDPSNWLQLTYVRTRRAILYYVRDPGPGFSFDALPHAAVSNPQDEPLQHVLSRAEHGLRPGGFGILLTQQLADELLYNEKGNEVLLIKYLG